MAEVENNRRVIVAGSLIMDLVVRVPHHPSVGETIVGHDFRTFPGGKGANQAVAAAKAGTKTQMLGCRGADDFGDELVAFLSAAGVDTTHVNIDEEAATGVGHVAVADDGSNAIIVVPGANGSFSPTAIRQLKLSSKDVLVAQLEIPFETIQVIFERAREAGARTILNAAPAADGAERLLQLTDILVVNEVELAHFAKQDVDAKDVSKITETVDSLRAHVDQIIIVTLGEAGLMGFANGEVINVPARKVMAVDTTGAGDCFTGSLAALLAEGAPLEQALRFANKAASLSVQVPGAGPSMPSRLQVEQIVD